ncbi:hypothetical protein PoB_006015300 [Plakobranchus ocellatus]|uniref:Uncharacterized protein n=1 Tax=Plakobranchus ocellatus TaxID=259542 RepID=A0AAV4CP62_9GAST|nr:hypothetical protein PoB_006015300 [Plakobranchus ocellatus]
MSLLDQFRFIAPKCPKKRAGHSKNSSGNQADLLAPHTEHAQAGKLPDGKAQLVAVSPGRVWVWGCQNALLTIKSAVSTPASRDLPLLGSTSDPTREGWGSKFQMLVKLPLNGCIWAKLILPFVVVAVDAAVAAVIDIVVVIVMVICFTRFEFEKL